MRFTDRLMSDAAGFMHVVMAAIGDRLGIWDHLAEHGAATSLELARAMGLSERHVREWLVAMAAAGYVERDEATYAYRLRDEHATVLTSATAALPELLVSYARPYERVVETFRTGGGVPPSAYPDSTQAAIERLSAGWYQRDLVERWLPIAGLETALADGAALCDVGCGAGLALVQLARAFPRSRFVGCDVYGPSVHRARERARQAGVADRVQVHQLDAATGLPGSFDIVTTFDVVHHAVAPLELMRAIRDALARGGTYLCLEPRRDAYPSLLYGISVMYYLSTSLAHGGAGHETELRSLATRAGFSAMTELPIDDPCNHLYALV